jgi:hypothetical protein
VTTVGTLMLVMLTKQLKNNSELGVEMTMFACMHDALMIMSHLQTATCSSAGSTRGILCYV